jgi:hypothetical protein
VPTFTIGVRREVVAEDLRHDGVDPCRQLREEGIVAEGACGRVGRREEEEPGGDVQLRY